MDLQQNETVTSQATYRGVRLFATSLNYCIVEYGGVYYRRESLRAAKEMIDDLKKSRNN